MDKVLTRRLLLGITAGIAAYKAAELARLLQRNNVDVRVAMTESATRFVGAATFQALTGKPVATSLWDTDIANGMAHIELSRGVDAILVAPATAAFIAKVAHGIANLSSGKMGYAIAEAAAALGAEVTLVSGPTALTPPPQAHFVYVTTAAEMFSAVKAHVAGTDYFFSVAAVADYTPVARLNRKLKKSSEAMEVELKPTEDILAHVAALPGGPFCVGFAAESENLADYAQAKRAKKKIPMIVANLVQHTIGKDENEVTIYDDTGAHSLARAPKSKIAHDIVAHALGLHERVPATVTPIKQAS